MTEDEALDVLSVALREVAPGADLAAADLDGLLQDEFDLDSIDFLGVIDAVRDKAGIEIPDRDFPSLATARGFAAYLARRARP